MNAARQRLRRLDRAAGARTRSALSDCIVRTVSFGPDPLEASGGPTRSFQYCDDLIEAFRRYMELPKERIRAFFNGEAIAKPRENGRAGVPPPAADGDGTPSLPGFAIASGEKVKVEGEQRMVSHPPVPVINTGNPGEYTIKQLAEKTIELVNKSALQLHLPPTTSRLVYKPLPGDDPKKRKPDITLAHALLDGWEPKVPLQEGLAKTITYFRGRFAVKMVE